MTPPRIRGLVDKVARAAKLECFANKEDKPSRRRELLKAKMDALNAFALLSEPKPSVHDHGAAGRWSNKDNVADGLAAYREAIAKPKPPVQKPVAVVDVIDWQEGPYNFRALKILDIGKHLLYAAPQPSDDLPGMWHESDLSGGATDCVQPSDDVAKDAARWRMMVKICENVKTDPDNRAHEKEYKAYLAAVLAGLDVTGAIDAAMAGGGV